MDPGLTASLLGYQSSTQLAASPLLGRIFESAGIMLVSQTLAASKKLYHWRLNETREVDLLIEIDHSHLIPVEFKMTARPTSADTQGIAAFMDSYKETEFGIVVSLNDSCFWLSKKILHVPMAML